MWLYTDTVTEHFQNPRNVGEINNADGVGDVGSLIPAGMARNAGEAS